MVQSCMVLKEEYYFPISDGGTVQKESCRGKVGADNKLVFNWDGVSAVFSVRKFGEPLHFGVTFKIEQGATVVWPEQEIMVKTDIDESKLSFDSFKTILSYGDDFKTASHAIGAIFTNDKSKEIESFFQSIDLPNNSVEWVEVKNINIIVNGQEIQLPKMRFEKTSGVFLHPLNC